MSSQIPQNFSYDDQYDSSSRIARHSKEAQASSTSSISAIYVPPSSSSQLLHQQNYAAMMQRQLVLNGVMPVSMPVTSTTPSTTFSPVQALASGGQQQMPIPTPFPYLPGCAYGSLPFLQPSLWLHPFATPPQTNVSQSGCSTPDSGISVGTPYGAISSTTMLTPFITPPTALNPTSTCCFGGALGAAQVQSTPTNLGDERCQRKRKGNTSHRIRRDYCNLCQSTIHAEGRRSQGPRRHVLQFHVMKPLYRCRLCEYSSPYDKYHIASHARRVHGTDRLRDVLVDNAAEFEGDIQYWTQKCFTTNATDSNEFHSNEATISSTTTAEPRATPLAPVRKKICSFAVEDLLADDDIDSSQKTIPLNATPSAIGSQPQVATSFPDVQQDSEASEDDGVDMSVSPKQGITDMKPKRLFVIDEHKVQC